MEPLILFNILFDVFLCVVCCLEFHKRNKQIASLTSRIRKLEGDKRTAQVFAEIKGDNLVVAPIREGIIEVHQDIPPEAWEIVRSKKVKLIRELPEMKRRPETNFYLFSGDMFDMGTHKYEMAIYKDTGEVKVVRCDKGCFAEGGIFKGPTNAIV